MKRESWGSRFGFMLAAVGSAIGLANIVRFPYLVGQNGGSAFIITYLGCLALIGFPVFIAEVTLGRHTQSNPYGAFRQIGRTPFWSVAGCVIVITGFIVSAFYSALAGWILGYFVEALRNNVAHFTSIADSKVHYETLITTPWWGPVFHGLFMLLCMLILYTGVRSGLERVSKWLMPCMFVVLLYLVVVGLRLPNSEAGLAFLFKVNWDAITPSVLLMALGQAFFTLSAGQGTMITYGSYLKRDVNLVSSTWPIVLADTLVSIFAAIIVFSIVFSVGMEPDSGLELIFHTLPVVFSKMGLGPWLAGAFFLLVTIAAITSEISAMEPVIAFLTDEKGMNRHKAVLSVGLGAFILGLPCAMSYSLFHHIQIEGMSLLQAFDFVATGILIPFGGLLAVTLVGWRWGMHNALEELNLGSGGFLRRNGWFCSYLTWGIQFIAPVVIFAVAARAIGLI